ALRPMEGRYLPRQLPLCLLGLGTRLFEGLCQGLQALLGLCHSARKGCKVTQIFGHLLSPCTYQTLVLPLPDQGFLSCCCHALTFCGRLCCFLLQCGRLQLECFEACLCCLSRGKLHLSLVHLRCERGRVSMPQFPESLFEGEDIRLLLEDCCIVADDIGLYRVVLLFEFMDLCLHAFEGCLVGWRNISPLWGRMV